MDWAAARLTGQCSVQLVVPPRAVVLAFEQSISPIDSRIGVSEHQSRALIALRDAVLPKLISGELCVQSAERLVERAV